MSDVVAGKPLTRFALSCAVSWLLVTTSLAEVPYRTLVPTGSTPHPAVLLVPGCSGFAANNGINVYDERAAALQAAGFFVVYVDYIGKRMQSNCAHVGQAEVSADISEAAAWTAGQTGVDARKISVIGWSYGAGGVLAALRDAPPEAPIAKAVLYYPVCRGAGPWSASVSALMLLGAADDIALPALCNAVTSGMPPEKLRVITYPNARHGFDMRGLPDPAGPPSGTPGYNAEASEASWAAVSEFLQ